MTEPDQAINTLKKPWTSNDLRQVWTFVGGTEGGGFETFLKAVFWLDGFQSSPPGSCKTEENAATLYNLAAFAAWGDFAFLNNPKAQS